MNEIQVINQILKMEDEFDLFQQRVDGVYFWESTRFNIFNKIIIELKFINQSHYSIELSYLNRIKIILNSIKNFFRKNLMLKRKKADILFFGHQRRKLEDDGLWWDIYTDPIINMLENQTNYKCVSVELYHNGSHRTPAKTENLYYLDYLIFKANLRKIYIKRKFRLSRTENILLEKIQSYLQENLAVEIDIKAEVTNILIGRKCYVPLFERLLRNVKPSIVVVVASYSNKIEFFIEACKNLNIKTVELQHGIISPYQLGYSYAGNNRIKRNFVDYLFTFGDFWKDKIEFPISGNSIFSVGYPYFEVQIRKYEHIEKQNNILIISQGTAGNVLSDLAIELSKNKELGMKIVYKLHPSESYNWQSVYKELFKFSKNEELEVVDSDIPNLYELFAFSKAQIGVSSAALVEGLAFGLPTYVLSHLENIFLQGLIDEGNIQIINSADDFVKKFMIYVDNKLKIDGSYYFKKNALSNIKKKISELLDSEMKNKIDNYH